jgi:tRNA-2-methylthio-N6-dimethylallyladenosine synthase
MQYHIQTYGCQMNYSDTERVTTVLHKMKYKPAESGFADADLIILNTCSVKQKAHDRVYGLNKQFRQFKAKNPKLKIGITGCMARQTGIRDSLEDDNFRHMDSLDFVFKIKDLMQLPSMLNHFHKVTGADEVTDMMHYFHINPTITNIAQVFIPIMSGCNNYCSFCIVPFTRGKEEYRPMSELLDEVEKVAKRGAIEINLVGQNVNTYKPKDADGDSEESPFAQLLRKIDAVKGIERIRFYTVHPKDMGDDVIALYGELDSMVPHLHLPVQSGSDTMLRRMNRWYDTDRFRELVAKMRKQVPGIAISTDIIVGFCGETEEEFMKTYNMVKELKIDLIYISQYSERKGTLADRTLEDDVPQKVKKERFHRLNDLLRELSKEYNQQFLGRTVEVLVEKVAKGYASGKIPEFKVCQFKSDDASLIGQHVDVKVEKAMEWALEGVLT